MRQRVVVAALAVALVAAGVGGCGAGDASDGKVHLSIATFGEFGYEDLLKEYQAEHPNVVVTQHKVGQAAPHHQELFTKLAAGSGLDDVEAVEEGYLAQVLTKADKFNDLSKIGPADAGPDRWLPWKYDAGKSKDGKLIGYGTDIGPLAMCYRKDLLQQAGLPSDPDGVKALFASWQSYFAAGKTYAEKTGKAWFDTSTQIFNAMHNQHEVGYYDKNNTLVVATNPDIKADWDAVTQAIADKESAKLVSFSNEWQAGFKTSAFATTVCPAWMLGSVEQNSGPDNKGKWAVTDAFPNGGGNWGGSYLTVPLQSKHPKEAAELAAWLTAPQQQIKAFVAKGPFPSQVQALQSPELLNQTNAYFGDAKTGALYAEQAKKVAKAQYKGPQDGQIQDNVFAPALQAVEQGKAAADGWQQAVAGAQKAAK
ncbi:ABC transporter substrate-binding protein [Kutzneria sp. CA-103260]|uniref:ABC transporter substrate-binding protein n=1 Tax=Kutzneria sp. CA-103260 TaxID=2802641 RepID=UPI001BA4EFD3|nr:ABC transporter substrate-binding protein [Kutzneria sp. CA-103260]QUQ65263.1 sugar ABC transporter periplasmic protein [Kutzneria sp. CA-103260]